MNPFTINWRMSANQGSAGKRKRVQSQSSDGDSGKRKRVVLHQSRKERQSLGAHFTKLQATEARRIAIESMVMKKKIDYRYHHKSKHFKNYEFARFKKLVDLEKQMILDAIKQRNRKEDFVRNLASKQQRLEDEIITRQVEQVLVNMVSQVAFEKVAEDYEDLAAEFVSLAIQRDDEKRLLDEAQAKAKKYEGLKNVISKQQDELKSAKDTLEALELKEKQQEPEISAEVDALRNSLSKKDEVCDKLCTKVTSVHHELEEVKKTMKRLEQEYAAVCRKLTSFECCTKGEVEIRALVTWFVQRRYDEDKARYPDSNIPIEDVKEMTMAQLRQRVMSEYNVHVQRKVPFNAGTLVANSRSVLVKWWKDRNALIHGYRCFDDKAHEDFQVLSKKFSLVLHETYSAVLGEDNNFTFFDREIIPND
jgi:hypothetical protein